MSLNPTNLYIQAAPLPATFRGNPNDLFSEMVQRMRILSPSGTNFIFIGDTEPSSNVGPWLKNGSQWYVWDSATKRYVPQDIQASFTAPYFIGKSIPAKTSPNLWLQTSQDTPDGVNYGDPLRWFLWNGAAWVWPHAIPPGSGERRMFIGAESDVWFYDGGDGTDPITATDTTGAMWGVDLGFNLRSPRGALVGVLNPADQSGADSAVVTIPSYLPAHSHNETTVFSSDISNPWNNNGVGQQPIAGNGQAMTASAAHNNRFTGITDSAGGGALPTITVPTIPASIGVYFIRRTARKFYTPA